MWNIILVCAYDVIAYNIALGGVFKLPHFKAVKKAMMGEEPWSETIKRYVDDIFHTKFYRNTIIKKFRALYREEGKYYRFRDIKLPLLDDEMELELTGIYEDTFWSYLNRNNQYDEKIYDYCDKFINEGLYGLVNDKVNVTVKPGDIVIDAGSWIGDFAAYASVAGGGAIYAFEPADKTFALLQKTAELNPNIIPVKKGLSSKIESIPIFNMQGNTGGNSLVNHEADTNFEKSSIIEVTSVDEFVRENNLSRVDFIKADIEGFERNMLEGAQETLREFAPKLALCTYHLPDDPEVLEALIKKANSKYNVVQKRKKLFASVPK